MLIKGQCREAPPLACFYMAPRSVAPEILLKALSSGVLLLERGGGRSPEEYERQHRVGD